MLKLLRLLILALIVSLVVRLMLAQFISRFYQIIAQEAIALLAHASLLAFKVARGITRPPQTGVLGYGVLHIAQVLCPEAPPALIPLLPLEEALQVANLRSDPCGQNDAQALDVDQMGHFRMMHIHFSL